MTRWFVVGAGGFGREVLAYVLDVARDPAAIGGFVDDRPDAVEGQRLAAPARVVARPDEIAPADDDRFVIAVGDPIARHRLAARLAARGARFASVVHPTAYVASTATVAPGCVIAPFAFVGPGAALGAHVALNTYASAGHDARLDACTVLSPYAVLNGHAIAEDGVFLGTHATVTIGVRVGAWSKLAAGAVATRDVPPRSLAVGNPARAREMFVAPE